MTRNPLVTIALSTYNVEPYLRASLDSILEQTYSNFELLCIDDASGDATWDILTEYAATDDRIKCVRQPENRGLAVSRNLALQLAAGEWIIMVDGDDLMSPYLLQRAVDAAIADDAEMVMWDYCEFVDAKDIPANSRIPSSLSGISSSDRLALLRRMAFTWVRMVRTDVMRRFGITYPEGRTKQDIPAHWTEILNIERIALIPERLSFYRLRAGATSTRRGKSLLDLPAVLDIVERDLAGTEHWDAFSPELYRQQLNALATVYAFISPDLHDEVRALIREKLAGPAGQYFQLHPQAIPYRQRLFFQSMSGDSGARLILAALDTLAAVKRKILPHRT